jgi:preprotein translocase subunit SecY
MLLIYRLLSFVPVPGVSKEQVAAATGGLDSLFNFMNMMTGSSVQDFTVMAMGISPYINASIIMQLLTVAIPKLEEMQKEGEEGRKKIAQITRYVTIGLGFIQAVALSLGLNASANPSFLSYLTIGVCLAAGTAMAMWIGERINENGLGNGISLLIFSGIVARLPFQLFGIFQNTVIGAYTMTSALIILLVSLAMIVGVVLVDLGERRIPVQYAKRVVGRKMYGGQSTHIPLKVNASGVLPLIFASAIMQFPATIFGFMPQSSAAAWWNTYMGTGSSGWYIAINALLILGFTFFYSSISFNPVEISKNIRENGGMIPGIRQGKHTSDFIAKITRRITLFGSIFLASLAAIPSIIYNALNVSLPLVASSLLIAVSVAIETTRQLESQMTMRHYKGFLK